MLGICERRLAHFSESVQVEQLNMESMPSVLSVSVDAYPISLGLKIGLILSAAALGGGAVAAGAHEQPIQWREAFVTVSSDMAPVKGHDGHFVGMSHQRGFAFYDQGDVATVEVWLTFERAEAKTRYRGYAVYSFEDESTKVGRFSGEGDPVGAQSGDFRFEGGTGLFSGIAGDGSFTGRAFPTDGDIYLDVEGTYSLAQ